MPTMIGTGVDESMRVIIIYGSDDNANNDWYRC